MEERLETKQDHTADVFHLVILLICLTIIIISAEIGSSLILIAGAGVLVLTLISLAAFAIQKKVDLSFFVLVPTVISALQNVYLSPAAEQMPAEIVPVVIVINFVYAIILYLLLSLSKTSAKKDNSSGVIRTVTLIMIALLGYGIAFMVFNGNDISAGVASARNLLSPMLFLLIGLHASQFTSTLRYMRLILILGWIVLAVAAIEYFLTDFWGAIGLHHLWEKKGIAVTPGSLLPLNFYASEQIIEGEFLRRMAGPFADPVNFGTFLFALLMVAWFTRSRLLTIAAAVASILTISKGALLGILTFGTVWAKKFRSAFEFILVGAIAAAAALYFYGFTQNSSTGSTQAHINGLLAAFEELPQHPLGRGFGGTGVLAGLFSEHSASDSEILESGLGMVIGQLGIFGFASYLVFFMIIFREVNRIPETRMWVLGMSLAVAFALNAAFNEVALSPNSSGVYFVLLGLLIGGRRTMRK